MSKDDAKNRGPRRGRGFITKNRAGNWQVRCTDPYGKRRAGGTFRLKGDADQQLAKILVYSIAEDFSAIRIFDPTELFCDETVCRGTNPAGHSWYRDSDYLNETGSIYVARALVERTGPK